MSEERMVDIEELIEKPLQTMERLRAGFNSDDVMARTVAQALCSGSCPALDRVPVLSQKALAQGKLPPNSLVRYRGMIQDQYEPEYYIGSFEQVEKATGQRSLFHVRYADTIGQRPGFDNDFDGAAAKTMNRQPLFCVPVPGQSSWAQPCDGDSQLSTAAHNELGHGAPKRLRDTDVDAMNDEDDRNSASENHPRGTSCAQPKNLRVAEASGHETGTAAFEHEQELDLDGLPCLVKMYDYQDGQLRLNDTTEFVGVLAYDQLPLEDPSPSAAPEETVPDPFRGLESFARKVPPPSLAPRLHCIFHRALPACGPLSVDPKDPRSALYALQGPLPFGTFMRDIKRQAIKHLAGPLGGDELAAEYALLALLSRVYARTESMAPGSLSLNLRGTPAKKVPEFHAAVSQLMAKCVRVAVTAESLSHKFRFAPRKNYEADRLMLSSLQLSEGTVVILDETGLEPGKIGAEGVSNIAALNSLLSLQKIPYDFGFYKMDFEVDHPTISLSQGRSVVTTGASVPVVPHDEEGGAADGTKGRELALQRLRVYIEATRRTNLSLDEASSKIAEEDFVKARQMGQEVTGEDFHRWLTIARLTALSLGDGTINASHWSHMKDLEGRVAERVKTLE